MGFFVCLLLEYSLNVLCYFLYWLSIVSSLITWWATVSDTWGTLRSCFPDVAAVDWGGEDK